MIRNYGPYQMILRQIFLETLFEAYSREFILTIQSIVPIYNIKVF